METTQPQTTAAPAGPTTPAPTSRPPANRRRTAIVSAGWTAHWVLRVLLVPMFLVYGWSKVFLVQMGRSDFGDALVQHGEMSPMGLLWRMMAYSPLFQCLSGIAEVAAGVMLLWRRTVMLGALLGAFDMGFVFLLNVGYDVPVKQLSLMLVAGSILVAIPFWRRYLGIIGFRSLPAGPVPEAMPWRAARRITNWAWPLTAVLLVAASGVAFGVSMRIEHLSSTVPGVYRVTEDAARPAAQLAEDTRWSQVALGQWGRENSGLMSIRSANGDLRLGRYTVEGDEITMELKPVQKGSVGLQVPVDKTLRMRWEQGPDGRLHLTGAGQDVWLTSDAEARYLFDRDFSWAPRTPVNR